MKSEKAHGRYIYEKPRRERARERESERVKERESERAREQQSNRATEIAGESV